MGVVHTTTHGPKEQKFFASFFQKRSAFSYDLVNANNIAKMLPAVIMP
jgi:hypothetical protein